MKSVSLAALGAIVFPALSIAGTSAISPGTLSTTGPTLDHNALFAATANPAMTDLMIADGERFRFNYFVGLGTNFEIGDANSFIDRVEELTDILDDPSLAEGSVQETLDDFNSVLGQIGEQGYVKSSTRVYVPGLPVYYKPAFMEGTWSFEATMDTQWRLGILDDALAYDSQRNNFTTGTSAYVKTGIQQRVSLGYSRPVLDSFSFNSMTGRLFAGAQLNLYRMELSKQIFVLELLDGDSVEDTVEDQYDNNLKSSSALGLDIGVVWDADWYRLGLTITDINSPEFAYGDIGTNCELQADASDASSNCYATSLFADEINFNEVHTKHATARTDFTVFPLNSLAISGSYELAAYDDIVGEENQWTTLSLAYTPNRIYFPALRLGLQKNMAGSELTTYGLGFTLLKVFSFDVSTSSETVEHDGTEAPRRFSFSLSFEESF